MAAPIELVIFDCDGVLVDSERLTVGVESDLITKLGWPLTEAEVLERFLGRSDEYMLGEIERHLGRALPRWQEQYAEQLHAVFAAELRPVDGVRQVLAEVSCRTCVASSGTPEKIALTLRLTGLLEVFEGRIFSVAEVAHGKPAPDLFLHAARQCDVSPEHCVVVEDSRAGVEAARAAGMRCLGYSGGITPAQWLEGPNTTVFEHMSELPMLLYRLTCTVQPPPANGPPVEPHRSLH